LKKLFKFFSVFFLASWLISCAPTRFVKPLEKGQKAISASFGGPAIHYSKAILPIPFTTLCYAQGISQSVTGFGALHFTSSLFGNIQSDIGASIKLFEKQSGIGISVSPALQIGYSVSTPKSLRLWPTLDLNIFYNLKSKKSYIYAGSNVWFELSKYKAHQELQSRHLIPNVQFGYVKANKLWNHQFEVKFLGIGIQNTPGVVEYVGFHGRGSFGFYYQLIRLF